MGFRQIGAHPNLTSGRSEIFVRIESRKQFLAVSAEESWIQTWQPATLRYSAIAQQPVARLRVFGVKAGPAAHSREIYRNITPSSGERAMWHHSAWRLIG